MATDRTILSIDKLLPYRQKGDETLEDYLREIDQKKLSEIWSLKDDRDLFAKKYDSGLHKLTDDLCVLPEIYNEALFEQSSAFFSAHASQLLMMLGLVSLPYCYGGSDGSKVLVSSDRILSNTTTRLQETGTFVWDVCSKNAFSGEGKGFLSCLKVRLIHQFIRQKLLKNGWNVNENGYPVNQLDQAGTNLSFSLIAIRAIRKTGTDLNETEMESYIHRWNVISVLLGLDPLLTANSLREASVLSRNIEQLQFRESKDGKALTNALLKSINQQAGFSPGYQRIIASYMGYLIGYPTAGYIGLPENSVRDNFFDWNLLFSKMKNVFPWFPALGFDGQKQDGTESLENMLLDIPLIHQDQ